MKRAGIILCALCCVAAVNEWERVVQTAEANFYLKVERPRETDTGTLLAWTKIEFRDDTEEGKKGRAEYTDTLDQMGKDGSSFAYILTLDEYDCRRGLERNHQEIDYGSSGQILYRAKKDGPKVAKWRPPAHGRPEETVMKKVCQAPEGKR